MHVNAENGFRGCQNGGWILFLFSFSILSKYETGTPHVFSRREGRGDGCYFTQAEPGAAATPFVLPCLLVTQDLSQRHRAPP